MLKDNPMLYLMLGAISGGVLSIPFFIIESSLWLVIYVEAIAVGVIAGIIWLILRTSANEKGEI